METATRVNAATSINAIPVLSYTFNPESGLPMAFIPDGAQAPNVSIDQIERADALYTANLESQQLVSEAQERGGFLLTIVQVEAPKKDINGFSVISPADIAPSRVLVEDGKPVMTSMIATPNEQGGFSYAAAARAQENIMTNLVESINVGETEDELLLSAVAKDHSNPQIRKAAQQKLNKIRQSRSLVAV